MRYAIILAALFSAATAQAGTQIPQSCQDVQTVAYVCNMAMIDARALIDGNVSANDRSGRLYYQRETAKEKATIILGMTASRGFANADKTCKREAQRMYWDREYKQAVESALAQAVVLDPARQESRETCEAAMKAIDAYKW